MKKAITFYFGKESEPEERMKLIAEAGFDEIILNADPRFDYQNGKFKKQVKLAKKYGLGFDSLHFRYRTKELPDFWKNCKNGETMTKNLLKDVKLAKKYGFKCVVVHLDGEANEIGFKRLDKVLKLCEKVNIPLAFENIDHNARLFEAMERYKNNKSVCFCFDIGHSNVFDTDVDFLKLYSDRLLCFHLHDNRGLTDDPVISKSGEPIWDEHTLNKYGSIDWNKFANKISKFDFIPTLSYELLYSFDHGDAMEDILSETYKQACELEKMIETHKKSNQK